MQQYKTIIFDLDGTLYDSHGLKKKIIFGSLRNLSLLRQERAARRAIMGKFYPHGEMEVYNTLFDLIAEKTGRRRIEVSDWFWGKYMPLQASILKRHFKPVPGLEAVLEELRSRGCKLAVLSDYGFAKEKMEALGIDPAKFDAVWSSPELGGLKPCPEVFRKACELLGSTPEETLMVGDRPDTDGGAKKVGMAFLSAEEFFASS